jgi:hypothetical protein
MRLEMSFPCLTLILLLACMKKGTFPRTVNVTNPQSAETFNCLKMAENNDGSWLKILPI